MIHNNNNKKKLQCNQNGKRNKMAVTGTINRIDVDLTFKRTPTYIYEYSRILKERWLRLLQAGIAYIYISLVWCHLGCRTLLTWRSMLH